MTSSPTSFGKHQKVHDQRVIDYLLLRGYTTLEEALEIWAQDTHVRGYFARGLGELRQSVRQGLGPELSVLHEFTQAQADPNQRVDVALPHTAQHHFVAPRPRA